MMSWTNLVLAVDINTADAQTIANELPGIGAVKAAAIVEHRKKHGRFTSVDDLKNVKGIGDKTVDKVRSLVNLKGSSFGTKTKQTSKQRVAESKANVKSASKQPKAKKTNKVSNTKSSSAKTKAQAKATTKSKAKSKSKSSATKAKKKTKTKSSTKKTKK